LVRGTRVRAAVLSLATLVVAGTMVSGCAIPPAGNLNQNLEREGVPPDSVSPEIIRPDGTLNNGLLPEQSGDIS
jgi:hypothetical protein